MSADNDIVESFRTDMTCAVRLRRPLLECEVTEWADKFAAEIGRLRGEVEALRQCGVKYLGWLGVKDAENALRKDMANPEMVELPAPAMPNGVEASPANCRERLRLEGRPYPRSGCAHCKLGGLTGCPYEKGVHNSGRAADNRDAAGVAAIRAEEYTRGRCDGWEAARSTPAAVPAGEVVAVYEGNPCVECGEDTGTGHFPGCCLGTTPQPADGGAAALWISRHWREDLGRDSAVSMVNREDPAHTLRIYVSTTPPAPVQAAPQEGEVYQPVRFGGIRRPSDEALAAAFWEHRQRENSLPADLCDSKLVKFGNDIVQRARELAPYLAANPSDCELGTVLKEIRAAADSGGANEGQCYNWWRKFEAALQHRGDSQEVGRG